MNNEQYTFIIEMNFESGLCACQEKMAPFEFINDHIMIKSN